MEEELSMQERILCTEISVKSILKNVQSNANTSSAVKDILPYVNCSSTQQKLKYLQEIIHMLQLYCPGNV